MPSGPTSTTTRTRHRRPLTARLVGLLAAVVVILGLAACSAGSTGNGGASGTAAGTYLKFFPCCAWGTTWSYNPYNANALSIQNNYITLPLAVQLHPSLTDYAPQLADHWTAAKGKLTVHLREDAKWQDGKPVTSKDLFDTAILDGTRGDGFWNDITDLQVTDDHTVVFTLKKGQPIALAESHILAGIMVYPSSVYGRFATTALADDVRTYYRASQKSPTAAAKLPEFKRMGETFKKLAGYQVDTLVGDGPFQLKSITTKEAKLDKWDGFWSADKIKFAGIDWSDGDNQAAYPQLLAGNVDFSNVYLPPPILKQWKGTPDAHLAQPLDAGFILGFNDHHYPLNLTEVRQALAYVIPRQQISEAAYGTSDGAGGRWKQVPTGLSPSMESLYLSAEQLNSLNKYPLDPAKATQLLTSKGFTKKGGQWMMPNGKPFTLTLTVNAAYSDMVTSFTSAAKALSAFGIKSDVNATSGAQQDADQHNGDFEVGMYLVTGDNPLGMFSAMMGPGQNFSDSGTYADKRGIGFGPTMEVPGLGRVNISETLDEQSTEVAPGPKMKEYTWDWAQLVNEQVPYLWYGTKVSQYSYSTKSFSWPPTGSNGSSKKWDIVPYNINAGISLFMQQGDINPKS